jgi:uroporphyrinogen-III synthase
MQENKIKILCTVFLDQSLIDKAVELGISIDTLSFIETEAIADNNIKEVITDLSRHSAKVVFTSMNAVKAVTVYLKGIQPDWEIFCIGSITQKFIKENLGVNSIAGTADSAIALADTIIAKGNITEVFFFCGNQRRDELPQKLNEHNITVNEIEVYKTTATPHIIKKKYDGIIFSSPSTAHSFFSVNSINSKIILFAIGNTTANTIKTYTNNKIVISDSPAKEKLFSKTIKYFKNHPTHH